MANVYNSGYKGKVLVGGTEIAVTGWEATHEVQLDSTTSTMSNGIETVEPGLRKLTFKFDGKWSAANNPYRSGAPRIDTGDSFTAQLISNTSLTVFNVTEAYVSKASIKSAVEGKVEWTIEAHANAWTSYSGT